MPTVKKIRRDSKNDEATNQKKVKIRAEEAKIIDTRNENFEQMEREVAMISNGLWDDIGNQNELTEDKTMDSEYETDTEEVLCRIHSSFVPPQEHQRDKNR